LAPLDDSDGQLLERLLNSQSGNGKRYPFDSVEYDKWSAHTVRRTDKVVSVSVPEDAENEESTLSGDVEVRESIRIQALIADIGHQMGFRIWLPKADKAAVIKESPRIIPAGFRIWSAAFPNSISGCWARYL
jgi:hypothetical protein